ncbi:damage-inducible protein CinA [Niastella yeongjuensis]|uniref:CinA-like protein n=1 Tax=Niastella yeongjuensis TaxID=354355 RepID=A0A1V9EAE4_9BACT|nr:CinA family nicotinamide mononucleotide deamidase-related protein [Niastella yeongjuensis]OQP43083.1 damage-inducible protein CinA [Niastella yeongjuensis]SEO65719.1 nicotinamide-nucleotide amidase [Niastella yeongjuensis]
MERIIASIITIGDELLIGQVIDTNSAFISQELNKIGVWVKRRVAVGDSKEEIVRALDEESRDTNIIIMTGGLGPTADDITKPVLADYFGGKLVMNEEVRKHLVYLFEEVFRRPIIERNLKQAEVPDVCTVLPNARGTAPGMWFEKAGKVFVSLPGVPHEMKGLITTEVLPRLQRRFEMPFIGHRTLLTAGVGESFLAEAIQHWEEKLPAHLKLAYLPNYGMVRLRITGWSTSKAQLEQELDTEFATLKKLVQEWLVIDEDATLPMALSKLLRSKNKTMSTAESCTGGYLAHLITAIPGASNIYKGSIISYDNEVKISQLQVSPVILQKVGAVSEEVVLEMAAGVLAKLNTDYAVAVSGIMGPDGGSPEKPVGTVWVAVGNKQKLVTQKFQFRFDRDRNIEMTATQALNLLRKFIVENA